MVILQNTSNLKFARFLYNFINIGVNIVFEEEQGANVCKRLWKMQQHLTIKSANVCKACRSRKHAEHEYTIAEIGFDPAENGPFQVPTPPPIPYG